MPETPSGRAKRQGEIRGAEITIDNVRKSFGALEVLHGVSAKAEDGEFVVLVGPSGCGKSKSTTADDCPRAKTRGQENLRGARRLDQ